MLPSTHSVRLFVAIILAIPAVGLLVVVAPLIILLSTPCLAILVRRKRSLFPVFTDDSARRSNDDGVRRQHVLLQHAVITGGSSGIGLSIAEELAKRNCHHITLLARKEGQLADAKKKVEQVAAEADSTTKVRTVSVDVIDLPKLQAQVEGICNQAAGGAPTLLFGCAGISIPNTFEDLSSSDFRVQVDVNYLGSVNTVKAFLPSMSSQTHIGGNIILISSMAGQIGTFGFSAYSPTKFALRGFAESLSMELAAKKDAHVNICLAYPPDTNTPGLMEENKTKPEECKMISGTAGLWEPEVVGNKIVKAALSHNPSFDIYFGLDGWMLSAVAAGMSPVTSLFDAICQISLMGLLRLISYFI